MNNQLHNRSQQGQIIIVVILVMLVAAVVVLAIAGRTVTDVKISTTSDESARAFAAAEAGVEDAVEKIKAAAPALPALGNTTLPNLANGAQVNYTIELQGGSTKAYLASSPINGDVDTFQVYLADKSLDPNLERGNYRGNNICILWGNNDSPAGTPAIEASVIYKNASGDTVQRFALDVPGSTRSNGFPRLTQNIDPSCPANIDAANNNLGVTRNFQYSYQLSLTNASLPGMVNACDGTGCLKLLRVRILYSPSEPQYVGVSPQSSANLPTQGLKISSTGQTNSGTTRKVEVFQSYPALPGIFDFALYNHSGSLIKN